MLFNKTENENNIPKTTSKSIEKKEEAIIAIYEEPLVPKLCRIIYWCMLIITASMILVDINGFIRYDSYLGYSHLFYNISTTGFLNWALFSVLLIILSYIAIRQTQKQFWKRLNKTLADGRSQRALKKLTHPITRYINICWVGTVFWGIFYLITHFI
jgi:hypothetical protein